MKQGQKGIRTAAYLLMGLFVLLGAALGVRAFLLGEPGRGALGLASALFLFIPPLFGWLRLGHPYRLYCVLFAFCIVAYDVGCVFQAFDAWPYFDKISHFLSGIVFTILGFCLYFYLARPGEPGRSWAVSCTYALFFSMFVAVVWEVGEFTGYLLTGHDSQHTETTGVFDTMEDLISCLGGSVLCAGSFLITALKKRRLLTGAVVEEFCQINRRRVK